MKLSESQLLLRLFPDYAVLTHVQVLLQVVGSSPEPESKKAPSASLIIFLLFPLKWTKSFTTLFRCIAKLNLLVTLVR